MTVITLSRQYGSGGDAIARQVAADLGYRYLDKTLLADVARDVSFSEISMVDFSEDTYERRNLVDRLLRPTVMTGAELRSWHQDLTGTRTQEIERLDEEQTVALVRSVILALYGRDNVIIVGRGGQAVLRDKVGVLHLRVEAPLQTRTLRVHNEQMLEMAEAQALVEQREKAARYYLRRFFDIDPSDPSLYHLVLNTGRMSTQMAVRVVETMVEMMERVKV